MFANEFKQQTSSSMVLSKNPLKNYSLNPVKYLVQLMKTC